MLVSYDQSFLEALWLMMFLRVHGCWCIISHSWRPTHDIFKGLHFGTGHRSLLYIPVHLMASNRDSSWVTTTIVPCIFFFQFFFQDVLLKSPPWLSLACFSFFFQDEFLLCIESTMFLAFMFFCVYAILTSHYGVATISRLLKIIGLFCKRAL